MLNEEITEHLNKDLKKFSIGHARQTDRQARIEDMFRRVMHRSDPIVMSFYADRRLAKKKTSELPDEVKALIDWDSPFFAVDSESDMGYG